MNFINSIKNTWWIDNWKQEWKHKLLFEILTEAIICSYNKEIDSKPIIIYGYNAHGASVACKTDSHSCKPPKSPCLCLWKEANIPQQQNR